MGTWWFTGRVWRGLLSVVREGQGRSGGWGEEEEGFFGADRHAAGRGCEEDEELNGYPFLGGCCMMIEERRVQVN